MGDTIAAQHDALAKLDEHLGEKVFVSLQVGGVGEDLRRPLSLLRTSGDLKASRMWAGLPAARMFPDGAAGMYRVGGVLLCLPPLPGGVQEDDRGIEWTLAPGVALRITWASG